MNKITATQQNALNALIAIGSPATSQQIGVQVITMKSLCKAGLVKRIETGNVGRECETILWQIE